MIEGVLVLVPTFALIFAFIDFGLMFYRWNTLQNAVREGARYAITFDTDMDPHNGPQSGQSQSAAIKQVVERYSMGIVHAADSPASITVRYCPQNNPTVCASTGNVPGNIVEVAVVSPIYRWLAPLSGTLRNSKYTTTPMTFHVYSYDILGGYPAGVTSVTP